MTMTVDQILKELQDVALPSETDPDYWNEIEVMTDNATDAICDYDAFIKKLINQIQET